MKKKNVYTVFLWDVPTSDGHKPPSMNQFSLQRKRDFDQNYETMENDLKLPKNYSPGPNRKLNPFSSFVGFFFSTKEIGGSPKSQEESGANAWCDGAWCIAHGAWCLKLGADNWTVYDHDKTRSLEIYDMRKLIMTTYYKDSPNSSWTTWLLIIHENITRSQIRRKVLTFDNLTNELLAILWGGVWRCCIRKKQLWSRQTSDASAPFGTPSPPYCHPWALVTSSRPLITPSTLPSPSPTP